MPYEAPAILAWLSFKLPPLSIAMPYQERGCPEPTKLTGEAAVPSTTSSPSTSIFTPIAAVKVTPGQTRTVLPAGITKSLASATLIA